MGARRIHIVDLDGAKSGDSVNYSIIKSIASSVKIPTQLGGGMRSLETISRTLQAGVAHIILGTIAVENPELVKQACALYPQSIIVSIDARDGIVATRGWLQGTTLKAVDLAKRWELYRQDYCGCRYSLEAGRK